MPATVLAAVGAALEAAFVAALAGQNPAVPVYRGGAWRVTSEAPPDFVLVGDDGSRDLASGLVGSEEQEPAGAGGRWRVARGNVTCAVVSQAGDDDMAARRARAETLLGLLDAPLRVDPSLGGITQFGWLASVTPVEDQNEKGCVARYVIVWHYEVDL